jgi:class 3 adenylate cyclase
MERVLASVLFADLDGFTAAVEKMDEDTYISFMTQFRDYAFQSIAPLLAGNRVEYGFWGDEVKVLLLGPAVEKNAHDACDCARHLTELWSQSPYNRARFATGQEPLKFKMGIATEELVVGMYPGARLPESEGRPLCTARSLSKLARAGRASRIYIDERTRSTLNGRTAPSCLPVAGLEAWELC